MTFGIGIPGNRGTGNINNPNAESSSSKKEEEPKAFRIKMAPPSVAMLFYSLETVLISCLGTARTALKYSSAGKLNISSTFFYLVFDVVEFALTVSMKQSG